MSEKQISSHPHLPEQSDTNEGHELNDNELEDVAGGVAWHRNDTPAWIGDAWDKTPGKQPNSAT